MFEMIMRLYVMAMATGVTSPLPHLFGPPGCGKSTSVHQLGKMLGVRVHTINVARLSPLEIEGVQMPVTEEEEMKLRLLHATFWTQLREGDILLLDEFLRGFPEVYNALLDIITSREVAGFKLPRVFIIAASNSVVAYDKALEDRLLHLPVPDIRKTTSEGKTERTAQAQHLVTALGLLPESVTSMEMQQLIDNEVAPTYEILDQMGKSASAVVLKGRSMRNLIGQAQLRQIDSPYLHEVIRFNNQRAMSAGKTQYVFLTSGKATEVPANYETHARKLVGNPRLTEIQALNLGLNLQLIELEAARREAAPTTEEVEDDESVFFE